MVLVLHLLEDNWSMFTIKKKDIPQHDNGFSGENVSPPVSTETGCENEYYPWFQIGINFG